MQPNQRDVTLTGAIDDALCEIERELKETACRLTTMPETAQRARALALVDKIAEQIEKGWGAEEFDEDLARLRRMAKALTATSKVCHPARRQAAA
jgi:hypothetical protein